MSVLWNQDGLVNAKLDRIMRLSSDRGGEPLRNNNSRVCVEGGLLKLAEIRGYYQWRESLCATNEKDKVDVSQSIEPIWDLESSDDIRLRFFQTFHNKFTP